MMEERIEPGTESEDPPAANRRGGFAVPNDARLGMVVGVGLLITIGVLFYRKDLPATATASTPAVASAINTPEMARKPEITP